MKRYTFLALVAACTISIAPRAHATLLAYDPFTGSDGSALFGSTGGFGWAQPWTDGPSTSPNTLSYFTNWSLAYQDGLGNTLNTSSGAAYISGQQNGTSSFQGTRLFDFSRGTNGTDDTWSWISMLLVRTGPTNGQVSNPYARGVNVVHDMSVGNFQKVGFGNGSAATTNTLAILSSGGSLRPSANPPYQFGGDTPSIFLTNFVILAVQHVSGGLDNAYLWVNPADLTSQPALSTATTNTLGLFDYSFDRLRIFVGGNANTTQRYGELYVSDYRLGETWGDVTPYTPVPEPAVACLVGLGGLALVLRWKRRKA